MRFKKNKIAVFLFLIIGLTNINSQELVSKIIYKKKSTTILDPNKQKTEAAIFVKNMSTKMNNLEYTLKFNLNSSVFNETSKMNIELDKNSLSAKISKLLGGGPGVFYTNRKLNEVFHEKEFQSEVFLIKLDRITHWEVTQEKKKIGNYTCFKATKTDTYVGSSGNLINRKIIAWYTPEIPYSYGPLQYSGLPGLILELQNDKVVFYAKEIYLNTTKNTIVDQPKKGIPITQRKFDSIVMGLGKDFSKKYKRK